jgi:hypothetical protein
MIDTKRLKNTSKAAREKGKTTETVPSQSANGMPIDKLKVGSINIRYYGDNMSWADLSESSDAYLRSASAKFAPYASVFTECVSPEKFSLMLPLWDWIGQRCLRFVMSSQRSSDLRTEVNVAKGYSPVTVSANTGSNTPMPRAA